MQIPNPESSRALFVGSGHYDSPNLPDLPAATRSAHALADILTDQTRGVLSSLNCVILDDPVDEKVVAQSLRRQAGEATDLLLVYFSGHGLLDLHANQLYLALKETDPEDPMFTALPFDGVRRVLRESPAQNRVLILDCCFSGRAIEDGMSSSLDIPDRLEVAGTYTLTATPPNEVAMAPARAAYTAFSGALLSILKRGDLQPLTLRELYLQLLSDALRNGRPQPQQRGTHTVDELVMLKGAPNARRIDLTDTAMDQCDLVVSDVDVYSKPGGFHILADVSFAARKASLLAIMGPSGAGKSSLLKILRGGGDVRSGAAYFDRKDLLDPASKRSGDVGFVTHWEGLHQSLSARQVLEYSGRLRYPSAEQGVIAARVEHVIDTLGIAAVLDRRVLHLSGAQRTFLSVAAELLSSPRLFLLDEATAGLDTGRRLEVLDALRRYARMGNTVVLATNSTEELVHADQVLVLAPGGRPVFFDEPTRLLGYFGQFFDLASPAEVLRQISRQAGLANHLAAVYHTSAPPVDASRRVSDLAPGTKLRTNPQVDQGQALRQAAIILRHQLAVYWASHGLGGRTILPFLAAMGTIMVSFLATRSLIPPTSTVDWLLMIFILSGQILAFARMSSEEWIIRREYSWGVSTGAAVVGRWCGLCGLGTLQTAVAVSIMSLWPLRGISLSLNFSPVELFVFLALIMFSALSLGQLAHVIPRSAPGRLFLLGGSLIVEGVICFDSVSPAFVLDHFSTGGLHLSLIRWLANLQWFVLVILLSLALAAWVLDRRLRTS